VSNLLLGVEVLAKGNSSDGGAGGVLLALLVVGFILWLFSSDSKGKGKHKK
jgi:hypothetical protein